MREWSEMKICLVEGLAYLGTARVEIQTKFRDITAVWVYGSIFLLLARPQ